MELPRSVKKNPWGITANEKCLEDINASEANTAVHGLVLTATNIVSADSSNFWPEPQGPETTFKKGFIESSI